MCPGKAREYQWNKDDPDDRYTAFWYSERGEQAIKNAACYNWNVFDKFNKLDHFNKFK